MIKKATIAVTTTGSAGSATGNETYGRGRPGIVRAIAVDYDGTAPATTDLTIQADSVSGTTLFTNTNSATDITANPVGMPGIDEANGALAATDASAGGWPFSTGVYVAIAGSNALSPAATVSLWIEY